MNISRTQTNFKGTSEKHQEFYTAFTLLSNKHYKLKHYSLVSKDLVWLSGGLGFLSRD